MIEPLSLHSEPSNNLSSNETNTTELRAYYALALVIQCFTKVVATIEIESIEQSSSFKSMVA